MGQDDGVGHDVAGQGDDAGQDGVGQGGDAGQEGVGQGDGAGHDGVGQGDDVGQDGEEELADLLHCLGPVAELSAQDLGTIGAMLTDSWMMV